MSDQEEEISGKEDNNRHNTKSRKPMSVMKETPKKKKMETLYQLHNLRANVTTGERNTINSKKVLKNTADFESVEADYVSDEAVENNRKDKWVPSFEDKFVS